MKNPVISKACETSLLGLVIVAVVFGAVGFFGGMQYQKSQRQNYFSGQFNMMGQSGVRRFSGQGGNTNASAVRGEILSTDNNSITVKLPDGSSKLVLLGSNTNITEATSASKESLKAGQQVAVFGSSNSDGSVTAQNIQLNPQNRPLGGNNR